MAVKFKFDIVNVTKSVHNNILAGSLKVGHTQITIVAVYGPQESEGQDVRTEFYNELSVETQSTIDRGSSPIIVGDLNAKVSITTNNTISSQSPNGSLLAELVTQFNLDILNFNEVCVGKWTRFEKKKDIEERSVIDYVMTDGSPEIKLTHFEIDEDRLFSPFWIKSTKKLGQVRQYSDHNPFIISFEVSRGKESADSGNTIKDLSNRGWKITPTGIQKFKELTESTLPLSETGVNVISEFNDHMLDLMDSCFSRRRSPRRKHPNVNQENVIRHPKLYKILRLPGFSFAKNLVGGGLNLGSQISLEGMVPPPCKGA